MSLHQDDLERSPTFHSKLLTEEKEKDTKEREFSVLENIKDNYPKYVLSMDEFDMSRNGIKHMNLIEFLTKDSRNFKNNLCN